MKGQIHEKQNGMFALYIEPCEGYRQSVGEAMTYKEARYILHHKHGVYQVKFVPMEGSKCKR